jgi:hypothetical protein
MPMRLSYSLIFASALVAAAPALAQDNAAAPANSVEANAADMNATANAAAAVTPTTAAATPGEQNATLPPTAPQSGAAMAVQSNRGFPWGVLGLLGLIGLFGVRKARS